MSAPINFAAVKNDAQLEAENEIDGYTLSSGAFNEAVLALVEAVEAAAAWNAHVQAGKRPAGSLAAMERWMAEQEPLADALDVALARFDFGGGS